MTLTVKIELISPQWDRVLWMVLNDFKNFFPNQWICIFGVKCVDSTNCVVTCSRQSYTDKHVIESNMLFWASEKISHNRVLLFNWWHNHQSTQTTMQSIEQMLIKVLLSIRRSRPNFLTLPKKTKFFTSLVWESTLWLKDSELYLKYEKNSFNFFLYNKWWPLQQWHFLITKGYFHFLIFEQTGYIIVFINAVSFIIQ